MAAPAQAPSTPLSPTARRLRAASELARDGRISAEEKAAIKDSIIRTSGGKPAGKRGGFDPDADGGPVDPLAGDDTPKARRSRLGDGDRPGAGHHAHGGGGRKKRGSNLLGRLKNALGGKSKNRKDRLSAAGGGGAGAGGVLGSPRGGSDKARARAHTAAQGDPLARPQWPSGAGVPKPRRATVDELARSGDSESLAAAAAAAQAAAGVPAMKRGSSDMFAVYQIEKRAAAKQAKKRAAKKGGGRKGRERRGKMDDEYASAGGGGGGVEDVSPAKDVALLHMSLRSRDRLNGLGGRGRTESRSGSLEGGLGDSGEQPLRRGRVDTAEQLVDVEKLHQAVNELIDEEERLLKSHMLAVQENADLLTEEGRLLATVQGEDVVDYDIDAYAKRLDEILDRKLVIFSSLKRRLTEFRQHLREEEVASKKVGSLPTY